MTSRERRQLTERAINHVFETGTLPNWQERPYTQDGETFYAIALALDKFNGCWIYLIRHERWLGLVDFSRRFVRSDGHSVFKNLFRDYARDTGFKYRELESLQYPQMEHINWTSRVRLLSRDRWIQPAEDVAEGPVPEGLPTDICPPVPGRECLGVMERVDQLTSMSEEPQEPEVDRGEVINIPFDRGPIVMTENVVLNRAGRPMVLRPVAVNQLYDVDLDDVPF